MRDLVNGIGYLMQGPPFPTVHNIDSGKLLIIKIDVKCAAYFAGVHHSKGNQRVEFLLSDRNEAGKCLNEHRGSSTVPFAKISVQLFGYTQKFIARSGLEVPRLVGFDDMVGGTGRVFVVRNNRAYTLHCLLFELPQDVLLPFALRLP